MAIKFARPADESLRALERGLRGVSRADKAFGERLRTVSRAAKKAGAAPERMPHGIYTASLEALAEGRGREALTLVGTRYIVDAAGEETAAGEVACDADQRSHAFAQLNLGPFAAGTVQAIEVLGKSRALREEDYEIAVIRIPALYVFAVWLRHDDPARDLVFRIEPGKPLTARQKPRALAAFLLQLQKAAKRAMKAQRALET